MAKDTQEVGGNVDLTGGFPLGASTSETAQAQQGVLNDVPVDVNFNAIVARSQALTVDLSGKNFEAAASRRNILADALMAKAPGP
jgi:hypothetical protein